MFFGTIFTTLSALLSRLRPRSSRRRRRRGHRRIWRRRRNSYRSRQQGRSRSDRISAKGSPTTAGPATVEVPATRTASPEPTSARDAQASSSVERLGSTTDKENRSNSTIDASINGNGGESVSETAGSSPPTRNGDKPSADASTSSLNASVEGNGDPVTSSASSAGSSKVNADMVPSGGSVDEQGNENIDHQVPDQDVASACLETSVAGLSSATLPDLDCGEPSEVAGKDGGSSSEVNTRNHSEKCLEETSGLTRDSGYTEKSANSIKSGIAGATTSECIADDEAPGTEVDNRVDKPKSACFSSITVKGCTTEQEVSEDLLEHARSIQDIATTGGKEKGVDFSSDSMQSIHRISEEALVFGVDVPCYALNTVVVDSCSEASQPEVDDLTASLTSWVDTASGDMSEVHLSASTQDFETSTVSESSVEESETEDVVSNGKLEAEGLCGGVYDRAERNGIALEEMHSTVDGRAVVGTLLVHNDCYEKKVGARHSTTGWTTYQDTLAGWVENMEEGKFDRFEFCVELPEEGSYRMELAFFCNQYWDSNEGQNHMVSCTML